MQLIDRMTTHLKNALRHSIALATRHGYSQVYPEHLLLGLLGERGSIACELLRKYNCNKKALIERALAHRKHKVRTTVPRFSKDAQHSLERSFSIGSQYSHTSIGTEHLLLAMLQTTNIAIAKAVRATAVDPQEIMAYLQAVLKSTTKFHEIASTVISSAPNGIVEHAEHDHEGGAITTGAAAAPSPAAVATKKKRGTQTLEHFARELTNKDAQSGIDPVIGREEEIERVVHILCRKTKNNPLLIGDPGVGKTAIVEGLAKRIFERNVPPILQRKRVFALDLGLMIAGTVYRGEFEARLKTVMEEIKANPDVIVFIDELHTIVGAGATSGSLDAANIIKPALGRGELRCIGATTHQEYKKHIESDAALDRRFGKIIVEEPNADKTFAILQGLKTSYEAFHQVLISDEALRVAVEGAARHLPESNFPDKAIDLLDEAAAAATSNRAPDPHVEKMIDIERELAGIEKQKQEAVDKEDFERALTLKEQEQILLKNRAAHAAQIGAKAATQTIEAHDIIGVLARRTGTPLSLSSLDRAALIPKINSQINEHIIGQEKARQQIITTLQKGVLGLQNRRRPMAVLLFVGPSGTGKTHAAKTIAKALYGEKNNLITIDMSEFRESYSVSKLLGAPAGYVGYREQTSLTDRIKRQPFSVVLFDEVDKAHPDVHNLFLQMFDEGMLTDATGRKIDLTRTTIIMTTTAGSESAPPIGFNGSHHPLEPRCGVPRVPVVPSGTRYGVPTSPSETQEPSTPHPSAAPNPSDTIPSGLKDIFRSELLYRIDAIVPFEPLTRDDLRAIAQREIVGYQEKISHLGMSLTIEESVLDWIADRAHHSPQMGRTVYTIIESEILPLLTQSILTEGSHGTYTLRRQGDGVSLSR